MRWDSLLPVKFPPYTLNTSDCGCANTMLWCPSSHFTVSLRKKSQTTSHIMPSRLFSTYLRGIKAWHTVCSVCVRVSCETAPSVWKCQNRNLLIFTLNWGSFNWHVCTTIKATTTGGKEDFYSFKYGSAQCYHKNIMRIIFVQMYGIFVVICRSIRSCMGAICRTWLALYILRYGLWFMTIKREIINSVYFWHLLTFMG